VGDLDKPKLVFFFDEAHLLFNDAPKALVERIELVVRLVRSKGVGVYFVTQNPLDVPTPCWASWATACSTRCAPSPRATRRPSRRRRHHARQPGLDIATAITELAVGEALVSFLDERAAPASPSASSCCRRAARSARSRRAAPGADQNSLVAGVYEKAVDRESAYEKLKGRAATTADARDRMQQPAAPRAAAAWPTRRARSSAAAPKPAPAPAPQTGSSNGGACSAAWATSCSAPPARAAAAAKAWPRPPPSPPSAPSAPASAARSCAACWASLLGGSSRRNEACGACSVTERDRGWPGPPSHRHADPAAVVKGPAAVLVQDRRDLRLHDAVLRGYLTCPKHLSGPATDAPKIWLDDWDLLRPALPVVPVAGFCQSHPDDPPP
jgi:hypothetical protein